MRRFLITSSDERTWNFEKPIIFLGEWCKKYSRKHIWEKLDHITASPYGIKFKQKEIDAKIAFEIENNLILKITKTLNTLHKVNYNERNWMIILGPWIRRYSTLIVNRVGVLKKCINDHEILDTCFVNGDKNFLIKVDSESSVNAFEDVLWNQYLNHELLKILNNKTIKINLIKYKKKKIRKHTPLINN